MLTYYTRPGGRLQGTARIPGDKSISHRAVILASIADHQTVIHDFLNSADTMATLNACRQLGVPITIKNNQVIVEGVGLHGLRASNQILDLGNSGTGFRLLVGLLAGQRFDSAITGDASLQKRPMERILVPLRLMGAKINSDQFPIHIHGSVLHGIYYSLPIPSAQIKSCLLLAGLYAEGKTTITESVSTRDHTELLLQCHGEKEIFIPADISSAAFFIVGASIAPGSDILLENIGVNLTRMGMIHILRLMGADIIFENPRMLGAESVADIRVRYAPLQGIDIPKEYIVSAIDEFPIIFIAAACATGVTRLQGAGELRVKESDRIATMVKGLQILGIQAETLSDGVIIEGGQIRGGEVDSAGDHRVAMAFAIAGLAAKQPIMIHDCANIATSFPEFVTVAQQLGLEIFSEPHH
jgi:5-enolpyruvylshikimate-3-phosphate synthase